MATKKSWNEKLQNSKPTQVKKIDFAFADIPANSIMHIANPKIVDAYIQQIPEGNMVTPKTMRKDLAIENRAEYTCPITTGIFLRIVAEAAYEKYQQTQSIEGITPFWRVIDPASALAGKLSFDKAFIVKQQEAEGIIL